MAKNYTVPEAMEIISAKVNEKTGKKTMNRFNKKKFNILMTALVNDPNFTSKVATVKGGNLASVEDVMATNSFRKWCQKLLEQSGIDKSESARVLDPSFVFNDMDGLYEFFVSAIYEYMAAGNQFDLIPTADFKGSIYLKDIDEKVVTADAYNPKDRSIKIGTFTTTKKKHKELGVKTGCPTFLKNREEVFKK